MRVSIRVSRGLNNYRYYFLGGGGGDGGSLLEV